MFYSKQTLPSHDGEDKADKLNISKFHKSKVIGGFTLVELVIVIIVLAILATIAFLNFHGYASSSRDSTRLADINSLNKSLELYNIKSGKYPDPTNIYTKVSYSGGTIFEQGTIGDSVFRILSDNINKKPIDPLDSTEYTYSTNIGRVEYQLKGNLENKLQVGIDDNIFNVGNIFNSTNATGTGTSVCYVKGNFNGLVERTNTGDTNFLLAVPGLIVGEVNPNLDFGSLSGKVICNGLSNPCIISYNPTTVYVGEDNTWPTTSTEIEDIMGNLQDAYSGSNVASSNSLISNILTSSGGDLTALGISMAAKVGITSNNGIEVDNNSCQPTTYNGYNLNFQIHKETQTYTKTGATANGVRTYTVSATCNNATFEFGLEDITVTCDSGYAPGGDGSICVINSCSSSIADSHGHSTATALNGTSWHYAAAPEACSRNCNTGYKWDGTSCKSIYFPGLDGISGTADDCKGGDITLSNGQVWSACNLGANTPRNGGNSGNFNSYGSSTRGGNDAVNGYLYQWGRNKAFPSNTTALTTGRLPNVNGNDKYNWVRQSDWISPRNDGLWGGSPSDTIYSEGQTNDVLRQGPCPTGRHVPSSKDWEGACSAIMGYACNGVTTSFNMVYKLLMPPAGDRNPTQGTYTDQSTNYDYWSSSPSGANGANVGNYHNTYLYPASGGAPRGYAFAVRCIKN